MTGANLLLRSLQVDAGISDIFGVYHCYIENHDISNIIIAQISTFLLYYKRLWAYGA